MNLYIADYKQTFLANLNPRATIDEDNKPGIEVGLQLYEFYNSFTFDLCMTFLRQLPKTGKAFPEVNTENY